MIIFKQTNELLPKLASGLIMIIFKKQYLRRNKTKKKNRVDYMRVYVSVKDKTYVDSNPYWR